MAKTNNRNWLWWTWGLGSLVLAGVIGLALASLMDTAPGRSAFALRAMLLPGQTTHGHHQIELACNACHAQPFPSRDDVQERCEGCHAAALKAGDDKHPRSKFTDPRNAERAALLDATYCVTCHVEHKPGITHGPGVTLPRDYCVICHVDIAEDRPSHQGMAFDTCASSGCHSYHDNRATYEDFLVNHAHEPAVHPKPAVPARDFRDKLEELADYPHDRFPQTALAVADADHGGALPSPPALMTEWERTAHAAAGVNCSACHRPTGKAAEGLGTEWVEKPDQRVCASCHKPEVEGFVAGLHGMRLKQGLSPMTPGQARLPMKADAAHDALGCNSCHLGHDFDTRKAAVEACVSCHDDEHTLAYEASPHAVLWKKELAGEAPPGSGVSCATCHMPRVEHRTPDYVKRTLVQHNQSGNLKPTVKMARSVCMNCHGLGFSLDALADGALARTNYEGAPGAKVQSIELALRREREAAERNGQTAGSLEQTVPPPVKP